MTQWPAKQTTVTRSIDAYPRTSQPFPTETASNASAGDPNLSASTRSIIWKCVETTAIRIPVGTVEIAVTKQTHQATFASAWKATRVITAQGLRVPIPTAVIMEHVYRNQPGNRADVASGIQGITANETYSAF